MQHRSLAIGEALQFRMDSIPNLWEVDFLRQFIPYFLGRTAVSPKLGKKDGLILVYWNCWDIVILNYFLHNVSLLCMRYLITKSKPPHSCRE